VEKALIVGLGNPGKSYEKTRHNIGFAAVEKLAKKYGLEFKKQLKFKGYIAEGQMGPDPVILLMPLTFMNLSGEAVRRCVEYYKVPFESLMVVSDDVALPVGHLRIRPKGSSGGHNGLKSIEECLGTEHYARLRMGIGANRAQELEDYVLGRFSQEEEKQIKESVVQAVDTLELWIKQGIAAAMQVANAAKKEEGDNNG
jgi:PTH1 family peptidyl-tRNA hydrolase